jgi:glycosyltransferase involved in cell wall biosynthesis
MADLRVIKNGVDLSRYATEREGGRDAGVIRLIMVGRLDAIKRHDLMLHALSGMASVPRWELSIVGDGPARESLEQLCRTLRLDARVKFLGQRSDVPALLADANIFALVSDSEGMSLSLIEAIASGLPVVATTVGNNSELVRNGWNGVLIPPGDGAALEKALRRLVENDELRSTFGANSRHISGNELDLRTALSSYVSLYEQTRQARGRKLGQNSV